MQAWTVFGLLSIGGLTESLLQHSQHDLPFWGLLLFVSSVGWSWSAAVTLLKSTKARIVSQITGQPMPRPETDAKALAVEIAQLNAQLSQLRDTATAFDVSCDHTMQQLDARLRRIEQQATYVIPAGHNS